MKCNYSGVINFPSITRLTRKDFADLFGKICRMLQKIDQKHFAKPDKRRMSKEGGE